MEMIYPNGVNVPAKQMDILDNIPSDSKNDRLFINTAFFIFFTERKIRKQIKNGIVRDAVLEKFRSSSKYGLMKSI